MKRVTQETSQVISNLLPNGLKLVVDKLVCRAPNSNKAIKAILCDLPRAYYNIKDSIQRVKGIARYGKADTWKIGSKGDVCSEIKNDPIIGWANNSNPSSNSASYSTDQDMKGGSK